MWLRTWCTTVEWSRGDDDPAFGEEILNVTKAEMKAKI
jgi:hypothetical protein